MECGKGYPEDWEIEYDKRFIWKHDSTGAGYLWDELGQQQWDEVLMKLYIKELITHARKEEREKVLGEVIDEIAYDTMDLCKNSQEFKNKVVKLLTNKLDVHEGGQTN